VSLLIFCHILFKEQPSIPVAFLFHERKFTQTREELFRETLYNELLKDLQKKWD